jgi:hypothetical protein
VDELGLYRHINEALFLGVASVWEQVASRSSSLLHLSLKRFLGRNNFLETMLKSTTEAEYTNAFEAALMVVAYEPSKRSYLESIYNDHEYYGGFFLLHTLGNLGLLGSVPAEQNHASIVAHLGEGASWEISQHIQHLMNHQKELTKQRTEKENTQFCSTLRYKSTKCGQQGKDDEEAKKTLSNFAYQKLFLRKSFQGA